MEATANPLWWDTVLVATDLVVVAMAGARRAMVERARDKFIVRKVFERGKLIAQCDVLNESEVLNDANENNEPMNLLFIVDVVGWRCLIRDNQKYKDKIVEL